MRHICILAFILQLASALEFMHSKLGIKSLVINGNINFLRFSALDVINCESYLLAVLLPNIFYLIAVINN